ncbi:MAG: hypothetical protein ACTH4U_11115 [Pseudoalteromonas prydzensis]|uniref:hypothetical protein n=2 Tax=Pseudoalteromonas TaxID=53246 RepID=UPI000B881125|nr:hypothetical protein [Pseudoalteromonas sp. DSM 26666]
MTRFIEIHSLIAYNNSSNIYFKQENLKMDLSVKTIGCDYVFDDKPEPFTTELELVDKFEKLLDVFSHKKVLVEREFDCGYGIADAVIFNYKSDSSLLDLSKIQDDWAYTLKSLPYRQNFDVYLLAEMSGASLAVSKKALKKFIEAGYCEERSNGLYVKLRQPKLLCTSMIAIEAKLRDWKKAIWQANRYKIFSNESWVLLDKKHSSAAIKNLNEFKRFNTGLATFSPKGCYEVHFSPKREAHKSDFALWRANTLLAKSLIAKDDSF